MKKMNTILLLLVAQIFTMGTIVLHGSTLFTADWLATYALLSALQVFFSAVILSAAMQHAELYRSVKGLAPVTDEYCPAELHRMAFLMGVSTLI